MTTEKKTAENFKRRGESYKEGMLLLITHLTDQDWKAGNKFPARLLLLKENVERIYKNYSNNLHKDASFNENKKHLDNLLKKYNDILLQHTTLKNSFQSLLLAERCSVWKKGRGSFETPVLFTNEESDCSIYSKLIQRETPIVDEESLGQEYSKITNVPLSPLWFKRLALWQQDFIKANWKDLSAKSIPSSLRSVPGIANLLRHDFSINNEKALTYFRHATPFPIDLLKQANADEEGLRLTRLNLASQIRLSLEQQLNQLNIGETHIREAVILTQSLLSPGAAATFKSQHISDSSDNDTKIYEMKEKAVKRFQDALKNPSEDKDFLVQWGLVVQSDGSVKYKGQSFGKITLLSTNHPLNVLRRFGVHPEQTARNDLNTALLLGAVGRYLSAQLSEKDDLLIKLKDCAENKSISSDKKEDLIKTLEVILSGEGRASFDKNTWHLFDALQTLLSIPSGQGSLGILGFLGIGDKHHRQSLVSAMEAIIINCLGATFWMACKSGKDRTGGASAACDAAAMFYELRGKYPRYNDADRALYLKLYKDLFESGHHQEVASQNAIGASGLIKPNLFLPDDMKLDAQDVKLQTQLARLNKPKQSHTGLFGVLIEFFASLIVALKRYFKGLMAPKAAKEGVLAENWLNSLNTEAAKLESTVEHTPEPAKAAKSEIAAEQPTSEPMLQAPNLEASLNMKFEAVNSVFEPISLQDGVSSPPVSGPHRQFASQLDLRGNEPSLLVSQGLFQPRIDAQMANRNLSASVPCLVSVGGL